MLDDDSGEYEADEDETDEEGEEDAETATWMPRRPVILADAAREEAYPPRVAGGRRRKKKPAEAGAGEAGGDTAESGRSRRGRQRARCRGEDEEQTAELDAVAATPKKPAAPRRRTPKVHVPAADLEGADGDVAETGSQTAGAGAGSDVGEDGQVTTKPRTRRGSRGGRNRKRKVRSARSQATAPSRQPTALRP